MTIRTFSSILPFTRRFGVRGVTCMTNGAESGGGNSATGEDNGEKPSADAVKPSADAVSAAKARWVIREELKDKPDGVALGDLYARVHREYPEGDGGMVGEHHVRSQARELCRRGEAKSIARGKYQRVDVPELESSPPPPPLSPSGQGNESEWYLPVANAMEEQGICTSAKPSGDDLKGLRWTNPDVVGKIVPSDTAKVHGFSTQLVAVEIKRATDSESLLKGFGQASAYLDFAHLSWLVVPWCENEAVYRVARLCVKHGIGLAYVRDDVDEGQQEWLEIDIRPRCQKPDSDKFTDFLWRIREAGIDLL